MAKKKILSHQKESSKRTLTLKANAEIFEWDPTQDIIQGDLFAKAFFECLKHNDTEGAMEMLEIYLSTLKDVELMKEADMSRSTFYFTKKNRNPTIKTLAKLVSAGSALMAQQRINTKR